MPSGGCTWDNDSPILNKCNEPQTKCIQAIPVFKTSDTGLKLYRGIQYPIMISEIVIPPHIFISVLGRAPFDNMDQP